MRKFLKKIYDCMPDNRDDIVIPISLFSYIGVAIYISDFLSKSGNFTRDAQEGFALFAICGLPFYIIWCMIVVDYSITLIDYKRKIR